MSFLQYQRLIIAYHGCDQTVADAALRGSRLKESDNDYDWLGKGIYFWEHGPARAMDWAKFMKNRKKVKTPAVIGALIQLGNCFDLLDTELTGYLERLYPAFLNMVKASGEAMPENDPARKLHYLDCAFLNWAIPTVERDTGTIFQTIRGVFIEGNPIYLTAQIHTHSHIQVAVRDPSAILGCFSPAIDRPS